MVSIRSVMADRSDAPRTPISELNRIVRTREHKPLLEIVKPAFICSNCIEEVAHRRVVCCVTNQNEMEQSGGVMDEIRNDASPQVESTQILVGKDQIRMAFRIAGQGSMNVEHAGEFRAPRRPGDYPSV